MTPEGAQGPAPSEAISTSRKEASNAIQKGRKEQVQGTVGPDVQPSAGEAVLRTGRKVSGKEEGKAVGTTQSANDVQATKSLKEMPYEDVYEVAKDLGLVSKDSPASEKKIGSLIQKIIGEGIFNRQNLAIPTSKPELRALVSQYLAERAATMEVRKQSVAREEASAKIKDMGGEESALDRLAKGELFEGDTGTMMVKQVMEDEGIYRKFMSGDKQTEDTILAAIDTYYKRGTDIAREMAARHDDFQSPAGRRAFLLNMLLGGSLKKNMSTKERRVALDKAKQIISDYKQETGTDLSKLTPEQLMDDAFMSKVLTDNAPKLASFRQKLIEFRRNSVLTVLSHVKNTVGNTLRIAHEFYTKRILEVALAGGTRANKRLANDLKELDASFARNEITKEEYDETRKEIINSLPPTVASSIARAKASHESTADACELFNQAISHDMPVSGRWDIGTSPTEVAAIGGR